MSRLLQIVPSLPPALNGVGDYATLLAGELQAVHGVESRFVVGDPDWQGDTTGADVVPARSWESLARLLPTPHDPTTVLLHYVGYGYARRGCPTWLVEALERWKKSPVDEAAGLSPHRLIVLFHETYASGPLWSSAFWTSPLQRSLVRRLSRLADQRRMTTDLAASELHAVLRRDDRAALQVVPVFSNLGELANPAPLASRQRQLVVFGSPGWRVEAYTRRLPDLADACRRLEIERVLDVGAPTGMKLDGLLPISIEEAGPLPAADASALFAQSLAGYFTYPVSFLAKSGIFAAYCAHRLLPVTFPANREDNADGLRAGIHYLSGLDDSPTTDFDAVAGAAHAWYAGHDLAAHAAGIRRQMSAG